MIAAQRSSSGACRSCLRRSWLLAQLGAMLDYRCRDRGRLLELLGLSDEALIRALGGRRTTELHARWSRFDPAQVRHTAGMETVCEHDSRYPPALRGASTPRMLYLRGGVERLSRLGAGPVVAIVGSRRASDYGIAMARALARGLAHGGVSVTSGTTDGIAAAAHAGALEVGGTTAAVLPGGLDVVAPARRRSLLARVVQGGCAVAELPCDETGRRWGIPASERIIAGLAQLTVVVEAGESPGELAPAALARVMGRTVAAVPGRVTSPLSAGTHSLLLAGAPLVRCADDVLELLPGAPMASEAGDGDRDLEPRLRAILERVGAGQDSPGKLERPGQDGADLLLALSELELMGLLGRGDGGRYVSRVPIAPPRMGPALDQVAER